jgi:Ca-activated chloride channel family protein
MVIDHSTQEAPMSIRSRTALVALLAVTTAGAAATAGCTADGRKGASGAPAPAVNRYPGAPGAAAEGETRAERDPQSTFAVDVDTASYGYAGRQIDDGRRPDPAAVRPEEFVNSFDQHYPQPDGDGFAIHVDGARLPEAHRAEDAADVRLLRVGLQTRAEDPAERRDAALTFVVDVSGSMAEPGRLDLVRDALHTLVDQLRPSDSVAIVAFSDEARVVREMTRVSDAERLHGAIDALRTESSTNLEAGLVLGYRVARDGFRAQSSNRVVILSDGLANTGETTAAPILRQVREEADKQIALLGVGVGSSYGDALMERLADKGDGFAVYVSGREQARDVFVRRLPATLAVRALDAKVQVTFDPAAVRSYRLIGYDNRAVADQDFRDDRVDGGEVGPGHSVTALYVVRLAAEATAPIARVQVRWLDPRTKEATEIQARAAAADLDGGFDRADARLRVCYAAGWFAEALRGGAYGGEVRLGDLGEIADRAYEATGDPAVRQLTRLIERAGELD